MPSFNALVYTDYGTVVPYKNITYPDKFLAYIKKHISYTKAFLYKKQSQKDSKGIYCAYNYPNLIGWQFKK